MITSEQIIECIVEAIRLRRRNTTYPHPFNCSYVMPIVYENYGFKKNAIQLDLTDPNTKEVKKYVLVLGEISGSNND